MMKKLSARSKKSSTKSKTKSKPYFVYVLKCKDSTLYTGITVDLDRRLSQHKDGTGAAYTRSRRGEKIIYSEKFKNRSLALKREYAIKQLSRKEKLLLTN
jgi:putative endonuclease